MTVLNRRLATVLNWRLATAYPQPQAQYLNPILGHRWISRGALETAFKAMSTLVTDIPIYMFEGVYDAQNVAIIANALARWHPGGARFRTRCPI